MLTLLGVLVGPSSIGAANGEQTGPIAHVVERVKDLGAVAKGDVLDHEFEIRNPGSEPLQIAESRSSCGCAVLDWDQNIAPGESGFVRARIDTRTVTGPATTSVTIATNDPNNLEITLELKIEVENFIGVHPPRARWDTVETETAGVIALTLFSLDGQDFSVANAEATRSDILVSSRPATADERLADRPGAQWRVELALADEPKIGAIDGYATLALDHPKQKRAFVPTSGFVRPLIHVAPEVSDLGQIELRDETRRARYQVRNFGSAPMKIERVEVVGIDGAGAAIKVHEEGFIYDVALEFDPQQVAAGAFDGKMVVHTDLAHRPQIEIAASGTVVKGSGGRR